MRRYAAGKSTSGVPDEDRFTDVLNAFLESMQIPKEPDLLAHADYFFVKSVGCVGVLKDWLDRALVDALSTPEQVLTWDIIKRQELTNRQLVRLVNEALAGELRLEDVPDDDLASLLGLDYTPSIHIAAPVMPIDPPKGSRNRCSTMCIDSHLLTDCGLWTFYRCWSYLKPVFKSATIVCASRRSIREPSMAMGSTRASCLRRFQS